MNVHCGDGPVVTDTTYSETTYNADGYTCDELCFVTNSLVSDVYDKFIYFYQYF